MVLELGREEEQQKTEYKKKSDHVISRGLDGILLRTSKREWWPGHTHIPKIMNNKYQEQWLRTEHVHYEKAY